ncbi:effector binding domain-containing protein [Paenibacillus sp. GCM10023248]|uniref:AraC family transcriptional regulator n=1 Tax=unclassified Paenibacillus TaxID=185978 RepID=UPI00237843C7|nr:AraC family transcriptional regulator [Paenibacillus sp. MAHUQ-63]MDD9266987.1 AraC family transcriptional regulator [Paenibacillus sp. MAHUQ-63]
MSADYYGQIQKTLDYIEEHLAGPLSVEVLARVACFSEFHFHRVFQSMVGEAVMDYVRKRRLARAAYQIAHSDQKLIDIAFDHGFQSHENFTRAFKKVFERTPLAYRKQGIATPLYAKVNVLGKKFNPYLGGIRMEYQLVTKSDFKLIGYELRTTCKEGQNHRDIPAFWTTYLQENKGSRIGNRVHEDSPVELGICTDFNMETGELTYIIGMEATSFENVAEDLVCREFPEAHYAVFTTPKVPAEQFSASIQSTWKSIFEEWFPHSGMEHAGGVEFELYDERCHTALHELVQMDIYIPVKPK